MLNGLAKLIEIIKNLADDYEEMAVGLMIILGVLGLAIIIAVPTFLYNLTALLVGGLK